MPRTRCVSQIFRDGDAESPGEYSGPRDADGIVAYVLKQAGPASVALETEDAARYCFTCDCFCFTCDFVVTFAALWALRGDEGV